MRDGGVRSWSRRLPVALLAVLMTLTATAAVAGEPAGVVVAGNQPWTPTGISVLAGDRVSVHATGTVFIAGSDPGKTPVGTPGCVATSDDSIPPGPFLAPGLTCFSLIGRVGSGRPFGLGTDVTVVAVDSGELFLGVNDNFFGDNSGSWTATVSVSHRHVGLLAPVNKGVVVTVGHGYNDPPRQTDGSPRLSCEIATVRDHCANQQFGLDIYPGTGWDHLILAPAPGTMIGQPVYGAGGPCITFRLDDGVNTNICHFDTVTVQPDSHIARGAELGRAKTSWIHLSLDSRPSTCSGGWQLPRPRTSYFCPIQLTGTHSFEGSDLAWDGHTGNQWKGWRTTSTNG